jgi:GT2 family glycosyltransferase
MCDLIMNRRDGDDVTMFSERRLRPRHTEGLWTNVQDVLATRFLFTNQTLAIRRSALESAGLFDESLWVMEDFELAMRLSIVGPWAYTTRTLAIWQEGSSNSLAERARRDQQRLNATLLAICRKLQAEGTPQSRVARSAIAYLARKSFRGLQLAEAASPPSRALLEAQAFIEERILERAYRNSWVYPKVESIAL